MKAMGQKQDFSAKRRIIREAHYLHRQTLKKIFILSRQTWKYRADPRDFLAAELAPVPSLIQLSLK
jgi:hypothetical protein